MVNRLRERARRCGCGLLRTLGWVGWSGSMERSARVGGVGVRFSAWEKALGGLAGVVVSGGVGGMR